MFTLFPILQDRYSVMSWALCECLIGGGRACACTRVGGFVPVCTMSTLRHAWACRCINQILIRLSFCFQLLCPPFFSCLLGSISPQTRWGMKINKIGAVWLGCCLASWGSGSCQSPYRRLEYQRASVFWGDPLNFKVFCSHLLCQLRSPGGTCPRWPWRNLHDSVCSIKKSKMQHVGGGRWFQPMNACVWSAWSLIVCLTQSMDRVCSFSSIAKVFSPPPGCLSIPSQCFSYEVVGFSSYSSTSMSSWKQCKCVTGLRWWWWWWCTELPWICSKDT